MQDRLCQYTKNKPEIVPKKVNDTKLKKKLQHNIFHKME
jgi:hypothetical protein